MAANRNFKCNLGVHVDFVNQLIPRISWAVTPSALAPGARYLKTDAVASRLLVASCQSSVSSCRLDVRQATQKEQREDEHQSVMPGHDEVKARQAASKPVAEVCHGLSDESGNREEETSLVIPVNLRTVQVCSAPKDVSAVGPRVGLPRLVVMPLARADLASLASMIRNAMFIRVTSRTQSL